MDKELIKKKLIKEKYKKLHRNKIIKTESMKKGDETVKKLYHTANKTNVVISNYQSMRKTDVIYRIVDNYSRRTATVLKEKNIERTYTHLQLIGCSYLELKNHLEKLFKDNMTFANYGNWEVDHIKPVCKFNLQDEKELLKCFHYTNLQPLWRKENRQKSGKQPEDIHPTPQ